MHKLVIFIFLVFATNPSFSQGLIWENRLGWREPDELLDVIQSEDSTFIACGTRYIYGHLYGAFDWESDIALMKFNSHGDTLWIKSIGMDGSYPKMCRGQGDTFYLAFTSPNTSSNNLKVFRIDFDGNVLDRWSVPGSYGGPTCSQLSQATDGSLLLVGSWAAPQVTGRMIDMFAARLEPTQGLVWFFNRYTDNPWTFGGRMEETPQGTFLLSGSAGSRIWALEVDSVGNEIRRQTFYDTPTHAVLSDASAVQQAPNGSFIVSGSPESWTPGFYYLGKYSSFSSSSQVWGGERTLAGTLTPYVQSDGSLLFYNIHDGDRFLTRIDQDSNRIWETPFVSQISSVDYPRLAAIAYVGDTTAIGVGIMNQSGPGSLSDQFYFCRIRGVGLPYHAVEPTATKTLYKGLPKLITYPTPAQNELTIHTRSREMLSLFDLSGKKVLEAKPDHSGTTRMDVSSLSSGMYQLRQGQTTVRVVKQ